MQSVPPTGMVSNVESGRAAGQVYVEAMSLSMHPSFSTLFILCTRERPTKPINLRPCTNVHYYTEASKSLRPDVHTRSVYHASRPTSKLAFCAL